MHPLTVLKKHICTLLLSEAMKYSHWLWAEWRLSVDCTFSNRERENQTRLESVNRLTCVYSKWESQGEKASHHLRNHMVVSWCVELTLIWKRSELGLLTDRNTTSLIQDHCACYADMWVKCDLLKLYMMRWKQKAFVLSQDIYIYAFFGI